MSDHAGRIRMLHEGEDQGLWIAYCLGCNWRSDPAPEARPAWEAAGQHEHEYDGRSDANARRDQSGSEDVRRPDQLDRSSADESVAASNLAASGEQDRTPQSPLAPLLAVPPGPCWNERHDLLIDVAAAAWGYRVAYEGYWGAGVPDSNLPVEMKQRLLGALVEWQQQLDSAIAALDDKPGDFEQAKADHRSTMSGGTL